MQYKIVFEKGFYLKYVEVIEFACSACKGEYFGFLSRLSNLKLNQVNYKNM